MKILQQVWKDIKSGQNLDIYVTIIVAISIAVLSVVGVADEKVIFSAVLATLAILSASLLISRHQNNEIRNVLSKITSTQSVSDQFFKLEYDIAEQIEHIRNSRQIYFLGTTLTTHIPLLQDDIRQCLQTGLHVKFLLVKPSGSGIKMAAFRSINFGEEELNSNLERNLSILKKLSCTSGEGTLECRVVDYLAPYAMYIFDPHLPQGHLLAHLSTFRTPNIHRRPTFTMTLKDDRIWFEYFVNQFEALWNEADPYEFGIGD